MFKANNSAVTTITSNHQKEFNEVFSIDDILSINRFVPTNSSTINTYRHKKLYSEYENNNFFVKIDIKSPQLKPQVTRYYSKIFSISIYSKQSKNFLVNVHNSYEFYRYLNCKNDENIASNWKIDSFLNTQQNIAMYQPYNYFGFLNTPEPTFDLYQHFNETVINHSLNLKSFILGSSIQKIANYFSEKHNLPESTLILVGLGVFSGLACRKWNCIYDNGKKAPICLYVAAEYDTSSGKSSVLEGFQEPFISILESEIKKIEDIIQTQQENLDTHLESEIHIKKEDRYNFKIQTKQLVNNLIRSKEKKNKLHHILPKTNITSQALEESLNYTNGFFIATADEQSLIDSLIPDKKNNSNEVLLRGRNAETVNSTRISREGYKGKVTGSFICFAQPNKNGEIGCIEKIIKASRNTGLSGRFLMISEPKMPSKYHLKKISYPTETFNEYAKKFEFLKNLIDKPLNHDELITLKISDYGWNEIYKFNNELEKFILPNQVFSHPHLEEMVGKSTLQIMSIASNLHLLECSKSTDLEKEHYIEDRFVSIAIEIINSLLYGTRDYLERHGFIGNKEELRSIIDYFIGSDGSYKKVKVIIGTLEKRKFLGSGKRQLILNTLKFLIETNNLIQYPDGTTGLNPRVRL